MNGYQQHLGHPAFLERDARGRGKNFRLVGTPTCAGVTWNYGPCGFGRYVSDEEPKPLPEGMKRMIFWQRLTRQDIPPGWTLSKLAIHQSRTGVAIVPEGDITQHWQTHAIRHYKNWLKQGWIIEPITLHQYYEVSGRSTLRPDHKKAFCGMLAEKMVGHGELVHIVGARPKESEVYEAAFACIDIPETSASLHHVSCCTPTGREVDAGTGLMAWWFVRAQQVGIHFLDFGLFWTPGEPESWQGFSRFKSQFGTQFFDYPQLLRSTGGNWKETLNLSWL